MFFFYDFNFDLPSDFYQQLGDFSVVNQQQIKLMKDFLQTLWPILAGRKISYKAAYDRSADVFNMILLGKDCPLSKCCKMTMYFQFTKNIGGRVICMESLCALNPLDHFFINQETTTALYYGQTPDGSQVGNMMREQSHDNFLSHHQYQKLKPALKQQISNEISKLISKGLHSKTSIRDYIQSQDIEQKALNSIIGLRRPSQMPLKSKKLTKSNMMSLLYEASSSQEQSFLQQYS